MVPTVKEVSSSNLIQIIKEKYCSITSKRTKFHGNSCNILYGLDKLCIEYAWSARIKVLLILTT